MALTKKLLEVVFCEARVCGNCQPVVITGDLNVELSVIPVTAKALQGGHLVDLEEAFSRDRGKPPSPTCQFDLDGTPGTRRDFCWSAPLHLLPVLGAGLILLYLLSFV